MLVNLFRTLFLLFPAADACWCGVILTALEIQMKAQLGVTGIHEAAFEGDGEQNGISEPHKRRCSQHFDRFN